MFLIPVSFVVSTFHFWLLFLQLIFPELYDVFLRLFYFHSRDLKDQLLHAAEDPSSLLVQLFHSLLFLSNPLQATTTLCWQWHQAATIKLVVNALRDKQTQATMGCGSSQSLPLSQTYEVSSVWDAVSRTVEARREGSDKLIVRRSGWKTIRIFVSSTFRDFHAERELFIKEVCFNF